jgi:hypothetical protein
VPLISNTWTLLRAWPLLCLSALKLIGTRAHSGLIKHGVIVPRNHRASRARFVHIDQALVARAAKPERYVFEVFYKGAIYQHVYQA